MSGNGTARVRYFDKQFLRAQDFADEQAYHVAMRRRHNLAQHSWGIVRGLELKAEEGSLFLQAGFAIDGYGREIIVAQRRPLRVQDFDDKRSEVLDVWVAYNRQASDDSPPGYAGCGPTGGGTQYRAPEIPSVSLEKPNPSYPDRRQPKGVPVTDYDFSATRLPPDDPNAYWPVFLGQVTRGGSATERTYSINPADRPYAGLVGESVVAPSEQTRLQIGAGARKTDPPGFAVFIPADAENPVLEVDQEGPITVRGDTSLYGNLTISGGSLEFAVGQASAPAPTASMAQPWKIYVDGSELRIEMAESSAGQSRVAIGAFSDEKKKFVPCLTISDDCKVTIEGDLIVRGQIQGVGPGACPDIVSLGLTKEARGVVLSSMLSGISGSSALLDKLFRSPLPIPASGVAAMLAANPEQIPAFAKLLKSQNAALANQLFEALRPGA